MRHCQFFPTNEDAAAFKCAACGAIVRGVASLPIYRECDAQPQGDAPADLKKTPTSLLCQLEPIPDTSDCRCTQCGAVYQDAQPDEIKARCAHEGLGQPPRVVRLFNFGKALGRHALDVTAKLAQGRLAEAYRTPEEIDHIFTTHCQPCPLFKNGICGHSKCGCNIGGGHGKFLNKLKWRSERCPDEPPKWT